MASRWTRDISLGGSSSTLAGVDSGMVVAGMKDDPAEIPHLIRLVRPLTLLLATVVHRYALRGRMSDWFLMRAYHGQCPTGHS
jgi:hypothetical protein